MKWKRERCYFLLFSCGKQLLRKQQSHSPVMEHFLLCPRKIVWGLNGMCFIFSLKLWTRTNELLQKRSCSWTLVLTVLLLLNQKKERSFSTEHPCLCHSSKKELHKHKWHKRSKSSRNIVVHLQCMNSFLLGYELLHGLLSFCFKAQLVVTGHRLEEISFEKSKWGCLEVSAF